MVSKFKQIELHLVMILRHIRRLIQILLALKACQHTDKFYFSSGFWKNIKNIPVLYNTQEIKAKKCQTFWNIVS